MSQRFPGGIVSSNPPAPSSSSASGIWTLKQALEYIQAGTWPGLGDPDFEYVTMLLPGNGTNGAQNNTFLDSSTNNFSITRNGNTTQGTFSPYGDNWSNYFDGNGDYLSIAAGSAANLSSGDFTIELWFYATVGGVNASLIQQGEHDWRLDANASNQLQWVTQNANRVTTAAFSLNTWNHVAISKSGSTQTVYLNGVSQGTTTSNPANSTSAVAIGINTAGIGNVWPFTGYISNARVVKGTAVYTGNFTPSTAPLTAITNTSLLTCQSNRFRDVSSNNFAITVNGNTSVQRFSPFAPTVAYSAATIGGSGYFDGTGDSIQAPSSTQWTWASASAWTFETWVYATTRASIQPVYGGFNITNSTNNGELYILTTGALRFRYWRGSEVTITTTNLVPLNQWTHIAFVFDGTNINLYIDGVRGASVARQSGADTTTNFLYVGSTALGHSGSTQLYFTGHIAGTRVVNGSSVYTGTSFTPPTAPPTAITNTQLLLNYTNAGIIDNAMMNDLETVGNAQISTSVSKWGGGSMSFDGVGDYLVAPSNPAFEFGTGNFTVEAWVWLDSTVNPGRPDNLKNVTIFSTGTLGSTDCSFAIYGNTTTAGIGLELYQSSPSISLTSAISVPTNTWAHIAFSKTGTTVYGFVNGTRVTLGTVTVAVGFSSTPKVGYANSTSYNNAFKGYIDDLRITKGVARYTGNFTPPGAPFPTK